MSISLHVRGVLAVCGLALVSPALVWGQADFTAEAGEYAPAGSLAGDQVYPQASIKPGGGFLVWQENNADGNGLGISARKLDSSLSGSLSSFRVNEIGVDDQERPQVSLLNGGGAAFVWQGGKSGLQRIYARFLSAGNTWIAGDVPVNVFTNDYQQDPAVTTLAAGNVLVAWSSWNQEAAGSLRGVYARLLSPAGAAVGGEISVNQATANNQRTPAVAALSTGGFVVAWVSEEQRFANGVDIYARVFNADGTAAAGEFLVNTATNLCANPSVTAVPGGGFAIAWSEKDALSIATNSWDVYARVFSSASVGGPVRRANTRRYGDQFAPRISFAGTNCLVVWTSMGQDGSREGVYGQFLKNDGAPVGAEFRVNTTTASFQKFPCVASDGVSRFLTVWSSFVGGVGGVDLFAQRYATTTQPLLAPDAPYVTVLSSNALSVTWPGLQGFSVAGYQVYVDGAANPTASVTNNWWTMSGLAAGSSHSFRLAYSLTDGRTSPLSAATTNTTYGALTYGGIPYDWMIANFGYDLFSWPSPFADSDGDGVSNLNEWLAGTNPTNAASVLRVRLRPTPQGLFLDWNTETGLMYQVQVGTSFGQWTNVGGARFAAGAADSMYVGNAGVKAFYRIVRLR